MTLCSPLPPNIRDIASLSDRTQRLVCSPEHEPTTFKLLVTYSDAAPRRPHDNTQRVNGVFTTVFILPILTYLLSQPDINPELARYYIKHKSKSISAKQYSNWIHKVNWLTVC